jgi:hypothetical protein
MTAMEPTPQRIREWSEALAKETRSSEGILHVMRGQLDDGADVNYISKVYGSPLINAVSNGRIDAVKLLLEYGANPNQVEILPSGRSYPPLIIVLLKFASGAFSEEVTRVLANLLLVAGANYRDPSVQNFIKADNKIEKLMKEILKKQKLP